MAPQCLGRFAVTRVLFCLSFATARRCRELLILVDKLPGVNHFADAHLRPPIWQFTDQRALHRGRADLDAADHGCLPVFRYVIRSSTPIGSTVFQNVSALAEVEA